MREWLVTGALPAPPPDAEAQSWLENAHAQRVAPLLYRSILGADRGWPPRIVDALRAAYHASFSHGVRQLDLAGTLCRVFEAQGLRALPLKGVALAETLYDSVAERPMGDVDILALDDWSATVRAIRRAGLRDQARADHAWSFVEPASGEVLELHHCITSCPGLFPVDAEGLWARSHPAQGQIPRLPSSEDLLVQLALHAAFQHGLALTLGQYLDFRRLLERCPPDPARLREIAQRACAMPAVALALQAAGRIVGAEAPAAFTASSSETLGGWLRGVLEPDPLALLPPRRPATAWLRWQLAAGRRTRMLVGTLAPHRRDESESWAGHGRRILGRLLHLARRALP